MNNTDAYMTELENNVKTEKQIRDENRFTSASELSKWIKQHLKMLYRVGCWCDGRSAWVEPNAIGEPYFLSTDVFLTVMAQYGSDVRYIDRAEGADMFSKLMTKNEIKTTDFVEVYVGGRRFVFATWVDWWLLRGLEHHI